MLDLKPLHLELCVEHDLDPDHLIDWAFLVVAEDIEKLSVIESAVGEMFDDVSAVIWDRETLGGMDASGMAMEHMPDAALMVLISNVESLPQAQQFSNTLSEFLVRHDATVVDVIPSPSMDISSIARVFDPDTAADELIQAAAEILPEAEMLPICFMIACRDVETVGKLQFAMESMRVDNTLPFDEENADGDYGLFVFKTIEPLQDELQSEIESVTQQVQQRGGQLIGIQLGDRPLIESVLDQMDELDLQ